MSTSIQEREDQIYYIDTEEVDIYKFMNTLIDEIEEFMSITNLNENETKIGVALIEVFTNYDEIFLHGEGNKFNKNLILLSLREMTNLTTKEIRNSLKKYKVIYKGLTNQFKD